MVRSIYQFKNKSYLSIHLQYYFFYDVAGIATVQFGMIFCITTSVSTIHNKCQHHTGKVPKTIQGHLLSLVLHAIGKCANTTCSIKNNMFNNIMSNILLPVLRQGVDIVKDEALHNIMTPMGMMWAFRQGLRCRKRGLGMLDIPCNSFTFMSSSQHQRTYTEPWGCRWLGWVVEGNCLAARSCLLIMLFIARAVFWLTENPARSALQFFPFLEHIMAIPQIQAMRIYWWGSYHSVYSSWFSTYLLCIICKNNNV